jgi:predicted DNA-binding transcriptional regulator YafY
MAIVDTGKLVDGERLRLAVRAFREAGAKGLTRVQLSEAMGHVILRTGDRAREVLRAEGARFETSTDPRTREKIFILTKGPKWDESISRETRLALRVAAMALGHGGNAILERQLETLEQITDKSLTDKDRKIFERLRKNIHVMGGVAETPGDRQVAALETVFNAFSADIPRQLELEYRKAGASISRKIIFSPYCLTQDLFGGGTFVLGEDAEKHKVMQLRLSRIENAKVLGRPVIYLKEAELKRAAEHQIGGWVSSDEPFEVSLRITGANWIQAMEEARPDFPEFRMERKGTSALVQFQANAPEGLIRWILQLGPAAEVLVPESLRVMVKEAVASMMDLYSSS